MSKKIQVVLTRLEHVFQIGDKTHRAGDTVEVDQPTADFLINGGHGEAAGDYVPEPAPEAEVPDPGSGAPATETTGTATKKEED